MYKYCFCIKHRDDGDDDDGDAFNGRMFFFP